MKSLLKDKNGTRRRAAFGGVVLVPDYINPSLASLQTEKEKRTARDHGVSAERVQVGVLLFKTTSLCLPMSSLARHHGEKLHVISWGL